MKQTHAKTYYMLGQNIRYYRGQKKLTQQQLGNEIGMDKQQIGRIERGETGISLDRLLDIAKALGITDIRMLFNFDNMLPETHSEN